MGLYGNLNTMSVGELLAWVDGGRKSGTLEVERDKIVKRITFEAGRVASCSSNDPTTLMGQFLLSSGRITRETLSEALGRQGNRQVNLGQILLEMGAIAQPDRDAFVQAKIEETIFGLFDWEDAVFRFYTDALPDPNAVEASLDIDEILRRGRLRSAERRLAGRAINDPQIVLRRTGEPPPPELSSSRSARRIFELIDGEKTVAEIVLHSHAPEFLVTKFLTALLHGKVVEIVRLRPAPVEAVDPTPVAARPADTLDAAGPAPAAARPADTPAAVGPAPAAARPADTLGAVGPAPAAARPADTLGAVGPAPAAALPPEPLDVFDLVPEAAWGPAAKHAIDPRPAAAQPPPSGDDEETAAAWESAGLVGAGDLGAETPVTIDEPVQEPRDAPAKRGYRLLPHQPSEVSRELQHEINVALQLMATGQPEAALELLNAMAAAHPTDTALRQLVVNAEQDFCKKMLEGELEASSVPTRGAAAAPDGLSAEESFLLAQIDGRTDIQALLWVAPMRDVDALKILYRMLRKGLLELRRAA
jgi:hypothetical protein